MPTKFFLRRDLCTLGGILPASNTSISATAPTWTPGTTNSVANTPLMTNRTLEDTVGTTAQTTLAYSTDNVTTNQRQPLLCFISEPLAAQSIPASTTELIIGFTESNTISAFWITYVLGVWRPSTGALVGRITDGASLTAGALVAGPAPTTQAGPFSPDDTASDPVVCQAGDVLVLEIWRTGTVQTMATSYTNTVIYDGRTEGSSTDLATVLNFGVNILLQAPPLVPTTASAGKATAGGACTKRARNLSPGGGFDNFDLAGVDPMWTTWGTGTQTEREGQLHQAATGAAGQYVGYVLTTAVTNFNLGRDIFIELVRPPSAAAGSQAYMRLEADANNGAIIGFGDGNLFAQKQVGGITTTLYSAAFPSTCRGFRIGVDPNGTVVFYYLSRVAGGVMTYTCVWAEPSFMAITSLKTAIGTGCYQTVAAPGTAIWDNYGYQPPNGVNLFGAPAGRSTANGALRPTDQYGSTVYSHPNLVAYWRLNEPNATYAAKDNAPGVNHDGTYQGTPGFAQPGAITTSTDTSVDFTTARVSVPDFVITGAFSVEAWFKVDTWAGTGTPIFNRRSAANVGGFSIESDDTTGRIWFHVYSGGIWRNITTNRSLAVGMWHHIVVTYDGVDNGYIFINGGFELGAGGLGAVANSANQLIEIGRNPATNANWPGDLDEVALYNAGLDLGTIRDHYRRGVLSLNPYEATVEGAAGLVAYWPLNEVAGPNGFDESGGGYTLDMGTGVSMTTRPGSAPVPSQAANFNNTGESYIYRTVADGALDFGTADFSVEVWTYQDVGTIGPLFEYGDATTDGLHIWQYPTPDDLYINWDGAAAILQVDGVLPQGKWHHVVAVRSGNSGLAYVDGALVGTYALAPGADLPTNYPVNLGFRRPSSGFTGASTPPPLEESR